LFSRFGEGAIEARYHQIHYRKMRSFPNLPPFTFEDSAPFGCGDCCGRPLAMWGPRPALMTATSLTSERSGHISAPLRPSDALRGLLRSGPTGEEVAPRQCCHGLRRGTSHPPRSTAEVTVCQRLRTHPAPARSVTLSDPSRPAHTRLTSTRVFTQPASLFLCGSVNQPHYPPSTVPRL
jgi:hypothetical protein